MTYKLNLEKSPIDERDWIAENFYSASYTAPEIVVPVEPEPEIVVPVPVVPVVPVVPKSKSRKKSLDPRGRRKNIKLFRKISIIHKSE
jgi:hypothetical protein